MSYFVTQSAAERYARYRPKVHGVVVEWLDSATGGRRFENAVDVACGTGDSLSPLRLVATEVDGVDTSRAMIDLAALQNTCVRQGSYGDLAAAKYDLISVCMAFHWFDRDVALAAFSLASVSDAIWLIYNFALTGHSVDESFNEWYRK